MKNNRKQLEQHFLPSFSRTLSKFSYIVAYSLLLVSAAVSVTVSCPSTLATKTLNFTFIITAKASVIRSSFSFCIVQCHHSSITVL